MYYALCSYKHFAGVFCPMDPVHGEPVSYPGEVMTVLGPLAIAYDDPPGVHGHGAASGGWDPDDGLVVVRPYNKKGYTHQQAWAEGIADFVDCALPSSEHSWCSAVLDWELTQ
jgi:hypothetical protein